VGIIATGGLSHFPELSLPRVGETDTVFDRKLIHWMETGEHGPLQELTADELHKSGSHEFLNWMVLLRRRDAGPAAVRYFGELPTDQPGGRRVEPAVSRYAVNSLLYRLKKDEAFRARFVANAADALADLDYPTRSGAAVPGADMRKINELGGYLHLVMSIPGLAAH
jgi:hypothetical protein